ncbi:hypothetical protein HU200_052061 [Digitaria exilis]|uniref:Uncharacterized protein n=1 Tax=Digitaria exilis TaxID=1010633 RepID=A0A835E942_9POAL|nr:hypothetical protein HU200_052061 [Digitaria exilis]
MESYTAPAKFDCLLFGEYLTYEEKEKWASGCTHFCVPLELFLNLSCLGYADIDDTLYPLSLGLNQACQYMLDRLHIEESQVPKMCLDLYKEHGTTMAGLKVSGYDFDNDDFHACVHGRLPYEKLKPDPVLRLLLLSLPQKKIIFTNSDKNHAATVLKKLGLDGCFDAIICFETLNPPTEQDDMDSRRGILCKPSLESMEAAIEIAKLDAKRTVGRSTLVPGADVALESIHNIKEALPELWVEADGEHVDSVLRAAAAETTVLA